MSTVQTCLFRLTERQTVEEFPSAEAHEYARKEAAYRCRPYWVVDADGTTRYDGNGRATKEQTT